MGASWRASRICLFALLVLGVVSRSAAAFAQECKRKTPILYIGICAHPHGPAHNEWTYDFSGHPVFGPAARQLVACHDVLPLFVFDPRADLKNRGLMPIAFHDKALACEPPPPPKPKPAPPPAPAKEQEPPPKEKADDEGGGEGKGGGGKGGGSGGEDDPRSIEKRVEKYRIRSESPPDEPRRPKNNVHGVLSNEPQLPSSTGILSEEGVLPSRDEVHPRKCVDEHCTLVDRGGALPEYAFRQGAPVMSVVPHECEEKTTHGIVQVSDASGSGRDCDQEQIDCFRRCWRVKPPWPMKKGTSAHYRYCQTKCLAEYMDCLASEGLRRTFETIAEAAAWLKRHPEVAAGTIFVIGGIVYVVSTGGAGALVLIPLGA
ncbi:MAG TPA: hypothetical protein VM694_31815 [Polyangium sp.]|nr:hypothetical protein [Polyangium sp.]